MNPLALRCATCALCPLLAILSVEAGALLACRWSRWANRPAITAPAEAEQASEAINPVLAELLEDGR